MRVEFVIGGCTGRCYVPDMAKKATRKKLRTHPLVKREATGISGTRKASHRAREIATKLFKDIRDQMILRGKLSELGASESEIVSAI